MTDSIEIPLESLPQYGLRLESVSAQAIHRFPDPDPADPSPAVPACVLDDESGAPSSQDPDAYLRTPVRLACDSRRFSLCSKPACFGRLKAVRRAPWNQAASGELRLSE
jgi:hypothetical protein